MARYLGYFLGRAFFFLVVVPAIFAGAFYGLLKVGFSPQLIEVWGLAVVAGSLVLLGLKPLEAMYQKVRGPTEPPRLPAWVRSLFMLLGVGSGIVAGGAMVFGLVIFSTVGSWVPLQSGTQRLGRIEVQRDQAAEDDLYRVTFQPDKGASEFAVKDAELKGEVVAFSVRTLRFSGSAKSLVEAVGMQDVALPGQIYTKIASELADKSRSGTLTQPPHYLTERAIGLLVKLPGVTAQEIQSPFQPLQGGFQVDLLLEKNRLTTPKASGYRPVSVPEEIPTPKDPPPALEPDPFSEPDQDLPPEEIDVEGPETTVKPLSEEEPDPFDDPILDVPPVQLAPPTAAEIALLRLGDPFEGL